MQLSDMNVKKAFEVILKQFEEAGVDSPAFEVSVLMEDLLELPRNPEITVPETVLNSEQEEKLKAAFADVSDKTVLIESAKFVYYPSDQKNFRKNIGVAAFKKSKLGLYMDRIHTPKDTVMDERNIEVLVSGFIKFTETL